MKVKNSKGEKELKGENFNGSKKDKISFLRRLKDKKKNLKKLLMSVLTNKKNNARAIFATGISKRDISIVIKVKEKTAGRYIKEKFAPPYKDRFSDFSEIIFVDDGHPYTITKEALHGSCFYLLDASGCTGIAVLTSNNSHYKKLTERKDRKFNKVKPAANKSKKL